MRKRNILVYTNIVTRLLQTILPCKSALLLPCSYTALYSCTTKVAQILTSAINQALTNVGFFLILFWKIEMEYIIFPILFMFKPHSAVHGNSKDNALHFGFTLTNMSQVQLKSYFIHASLCCFSTEVRICNLEIILQAKKLLCTPHKLKVPALY